MSGCKWRESRAYPYVIRWLSLPEEEPFEIAGDIVTQDGGRILAAVCDGNLEPIQSLILNRQADEWGRSSGVAAPALLAAWAETPRLEAIDRSSAALLHTHDTGWRVVASQFVGS